MENNLMDIYNDIISPLVPDDVRKAPKKMLMTSIYNLQALISGMIIGANLSGDKIDRLAEQIKKLNQK